VHQIDGLPKEAANLSLDVVHSTLLQRLLAQPPRCASPRTTTQFSALLPPILRRLFAGEHLLLRSLAITARW
jgi:hypothetical protein